MAGLSMLSDEREGKFPRDKRKNKCREESRKLQDEA
jgi:hypothetical protein